MKGSNQKGFSLIELVMSLAFLGLLAGIGAYSVRAFLAEQPLRATVLEIVDALERHAELATLRGKTIRGDFSGGELRFDGEPTHGPSGIPVPTGVTVESQFGTEETILLYPEGNALPGRIVLRRGDAWCQINQSLYGARTISCATSNE